MKVKETKRVRTLKSKLIVMLLSISLIPILISGIITYFISYNILADKLETTSRQTTKEVTRGINNYFVSMNSMLNILANDPNMIEADNSVYLEFGKTLISNVRSTDSTILNVYVGTEKGLFYVDPYAELPSDFDHRTREWYKQAIQSPGNIIMTDPYQDEATGNLVVTIACATQKEGKVVGVVGMDIDLGFLSSSLSDIKVGDSGYIYITDTQGILITHPDSSLIATDTATTLSFWPEALNNNNGFSTYTYKGTDKFASYDTSESTGWKIISAMDFAELTADTNPIRNTIGVVAVLTILFAIIGAFLFTTPISKNIKMLLVAFGQLSQGDLTTKVSIRSRDEFRSLGTHFNEMSDNIAKLIHNVSDVSTAVLDTSVVLSDMAEQTNVSINEVTRAIEDVAKGATEQAQYASTSAVNISELADKLNMIDESTSKIDEYSKNAESLTLQGLSRVETLIKNSDSTAKSTANVSELVLETSESMKQIEAISNAIDTITAQTNLLSLNASIEAARAGESGKGFAVVANEIRALAEQSKDSTVKIKEIIDEIRQKTERSVAAMEVTNQNVNDQVRIVKETKDLFNEIMEATQILTLKVTEIKATTDEIVENKNNVVDQIGNISAVSEESASATEEVTSSSEQIAETMDDITHRAIELHQLSENLQERINTFKF